MEMPTAEIDSDRYIGLLNIPSLGLELPIMTDWKDRFIEAYDIEFCKWVESVHANKLTGPSAWDGYVACVAGDALNASRGTSTFLKVETMEKPEMYK